MNISEYFIRNIFLKNNRYLHFYNYFFHKQENKEKKKRWFFCPFYLAYIKKVVSTIQLKNLSMCDISSVRENKKNKKKNRRKTIFFNMFHNSSRQFDCSLRASRLNESNSSLHSVILVARIEWTEMFTRMFIKLYRMYVLGKLLHNYCTNRYKYEWRWHGQCLMSWQFILSISFTTIKRYYERLFRVRQNSLMEQRYKKKKDRCLFRDTSFYAQFKYYAQYVHL